MQKRIYIFCLAMTILGFANKSTAQQGKSEFSAAYGQYSAYSFQNHTNGYSYSTSSGVMLFNYKYYLTNKLTLGLGIGYENISTDGSYFSITPEFTYTYLDTKNDRVRLKLYGGASIGVTDYNDNLYNPNPYYNTYPYVRRYDNSNAQITGNATLLGCRVGRKLGFFAELGIGYKGLINAGFSYRFRTKSTAHHTEDRVEPKN